MGRRMKFRSCNSEPCSKQKKDFREEQCAAFDGRHFNINGLPPNVRWVPKYSGSERLFFSQPTAGLCEAVLTGGPLLLVLMKDRCKLFCRVAGSTAYYQLRDRVIDGTPCGPDTNDICVQGLCRVSFSDFSRKCFTSLKHAGVQLESLIKPHINKSVSLRKLQAAP